jgi:hypothetical protein
MQQRKRATAPREDWKGQLAMDHLPARVLVEKEGALQKRTMIALATAGALVLRNNVGAIRKGQRFIRYGLGKGSSDLLCFTPNGRPFFVEIKRAKFGLISEEQKSFIDMMARWKVPARVVLSVEDALAFYAEVRGA